MQHNPKKSMFERNQDLLINLKWSKYFMFAKEDDWHKRMRAFYGQWDSNIIMRDYVIMNFD